jgi:hypothetical protein
MRESCNRSADGEADRHQEQLGLHCHLHFRLELSDSLVEQDLSLNETHC